MKKILLSALAIVAMTGCKQAQPVSEELPEKAIVVKSDVIQSKAITDNNLTVLRYVRADNAGNLEPESASWTTIKDATRATGAGSAITFTENYDKEDKYAFFKFFSVADVITDGVIKWTALGSKDIVYGSLNAGKYTDAETNTLILKHMLTRIEVVCSPASGVSTDVANAYWGGINEIKIAGLATEISYDCGGAGTFTYGEKAAVDQDLYQPDYTNEFSPGVIGSTYAIAGIMLPTHIKNGASAVTSFDLKITTANKGEKTISISIEDGLKQGKIHKVTLSFPAGDKAIVATSSVEDWGAGNAGSGDVLLD